MWVYHEAILFCYAKLIEFLLLLRSNILPRIIAPKQKELFLLLFRRRIVVIFAYSVFFSGIVFFLPDALAQSKDAGMPLSGFAPNAEALKSDIYSKLKCCACQVSFDKCTCPEAKEMKAYIDALLESGMSKEEIFYMVAKKYTLNTILNDKIKAKIEKRLIQEAGQGHPQIVFGATFFDFGSVAKGQGKISKIFTALNKGNEPWAIKQIKTSCPCATVSLKVNEHKSAYFGIEGSPKDWKIEVMPGDSVELEVMIDLASPHVKAGKLVREAEVISNDPIYPEVTLRIEADVQG